MIRDAARSDPLGSEKCLQQCSCSCVSAAHGGRVHPEVLRDIGQGEAVPVDEADDLLIDGLEFGDRGAHIGGVILFLRRRQLCEVVGELVCERMPTRT